MSGMTEAEMKDMERREAEAEVFRPRLECKHDYANAKHVSRAKFLCPRYDENNNTGMK